MPNKKNQWAGPHPKGGWQTKREGSQRAGSRHDTQADAWAAAIDRAKTNQGEAFLQNRKGQIRERNTYGRDPFPPRG